MRNTLYNLHKCWAVVCRLRHSHGYGVHSPFAYELITQVIRGKGQYYAYRTLSQQFPMLHAWRNRHQLKCHRFLFRLANHMHPHVLCLGGNPPDSVLAYMQAATPRAATVRVGDYIPSQLTTVLVYLAPDCPQHEVLATTGSVLPGGSVCVVEQIHASTERESLWNKLRTLPQVGATFDLYDYGLLFYDQTKSKQHHLVVL